jgi:hypothetical protein
MEFTRDYRKQFREAVSTNNKAKMVELFEALCNEAEIPDPERDQTSASAGKEAAERKNARDRGDGGKKI